MDKDRVEKTLKLAPRAMPKMNMIIKNNASELGKSLSENKYLKSKKENLRGFEKKLYGCVSELTMKDVDFASVSDMYSFSLASYQHANLVQGEISKLNKKLSVSAEAVKTLNKIYKRNLCKRENIENMNRKATRIVSIIREKNV